MTEKELNKRVEQGVFSEDEKEQILQHLSPNENGDLIGGYSPSEMPKDFDARWYMNGKLDKDTLIDYICTHCVPWRTAEYYSDPIFKKYGRFISIAGIDEYWQWIGLETASELDLWKIVALCNTYWLGVHDGCTIENGENIPLSELHTPVNLGELTSELLDKYRSGELEYKAGDYFMANGKKITVLCAHGHYIATDNK